MSEALNIALVGATGLIGRSIIETVIDCPNIRLLGLARRETALPKGARMEMRLADPSDWGDVIKEIQPDVLINCLGTTWKKSGKDEAAFRAVDQDLVLACAKAAKDAGTERFISVSSVGADARAKNFYLSVKGEVEDALMKMKFKRLDIFRPGLLKGPREGDFRFGENAAKIIAPISDLLLQGGLSKYRSINADIVAKAAIACAQTKAAGRFVHDSDGIHRAAKRFST